MIGLILICHGDLAEAFMRTAQEIVGPIDGVTCISNWTKSPEDVRSAADAAIERIGATEGVIIMADLFGSSCWRCGFEELFSGHDDTIAVIAGVNLGMILSFSQKRDKLSFRDLAQALADDGRRGISGPTFGSEVRR